jgi:hypothetical protein
MIVAGLLLLVHAVAFVVVAAAISLLAMAETI